MKCEFPMTSIKISRQERNASLDEALGMAAERFGAGAWALAESPATLVFQPWSSSFAPDGDCVSLTIFGSGAELRLERNLDDQVWHSRLLWPDEAGEEVLCRKTEYLMRGGKGKLVYGEYFREDESGFLQKIDGGFCDISAESE